MKPRLRRSEWNVLRRLASLPDEYWSRRGKTQSPLSRMHARGLIADAGPGRFAATEIGRAAYLAHPVNWGDDNGPANCH